MYWEHENQPIYDLDETATFAHGVGPNT